MQIKYRGQEKRRERARQLWLNIATDYNSGMDVETIRKRYKNKRTGKPYDRTHIYYILRKLRNTPIK